MEFINAEIYKVNIYTETARCRLHADRISKWWLEFEKTSDILLIKINVYWMVLNRKCLWSTNDDLISVKHRIAGEKICALILWWHHYLIMLSQAVIYYTIFLQIFDQW